MDEATRTAQVTTLRISYYARLKCWNYENLSAPHWRFYWNSGLGAAMELHGVRYEMTSDACYLIPPGTPFSAHQSGPVSHFFTHFTVGSPLDRVTPSIFCFPATTETFERIQKSIRLTSSDPNGYQLKITSRALIYSILDQLPENVFLTTPVAPWLPKIFDFIDKHLDQDMQVSGLAQLVGMNEDAFIRSFRKRMGITPARFVIQRRIDEASTLLSSTDKSIKEIAVECGFGDRNYFTTVFTRLRKVSPAKYRIMYRC